MCHPKCIFTLQPVAARLHDHASGHIKGNTEEPLKIPYSVGWNVMVRSCNIGYHPNFNPLSQKSRAITCGYM